ncbi:MAG: acyl-CoA dehydratase activase [Peptoniphilus sp.]|nr:acyl-CoA dehydratase activase [Peptoniphilus sp.]MDY6045184.1 acyl-CoA dehydratase activase [Peptoniphilus sp.]
MSNNMYYVCKYTPLELLESYGLEMERLDPEPETLECGSALSHPNLCGYGRAVLKEVLEGRVKSLFLVDCCDVCRRIYDVLKSEGTMDFLFLMYLPHKKGPWEVAHLKKELLRLNDALAAYTGRTFDEKKARELWRLNIETFYSERIEADHIVLTGAHGGCGLKKQIEKVTDLPVEDDTCTGNRVLRREEGGEFFEDYGEALLAQKSPCMRMQFEGEDRVGSLGTICHTIKFCDYYGFQYKALRDEEERLLKIETDCTSQSEGQIRTRLEAFSELIRPKSLKKERSGDRRYVCGIDSGSSSTNAVILDEDKNIVASSIIPTGGGADKSGNRAFREVLDRAGLGEDDIARVITTGYGRDNLNLSNSSITEISCHAKGARHLYPEVRTIIDIGGQDSKVIVLDESGDVTNFVMNDKCAAGTGRFLETMAKTLELSLEEMSDLGLKWHKPVTISSTCAVFAESEVVSLIASNTEIPDIINGLNRSIASKTASLAKRAKGGAPYMMTGGVSNNLGVVKALEDALSEILRVPEEAQICGALGAALFALE